MLVLTRKTNESLIIAGNIAVTVVSVENGRVRLGITAPRTTSIRRAELAPIEPAREAERAETAAAQPVR
jgi:carbon storage regulator